ncbi:hypothetical protein L486_06842 [Kwoniella mangroviensis CBS 10435]|uniref:Uncharacterized protein n=1 Tax=Kwoniella mangroviensis CBS 10435 TaxID=1331196 RepID=A0A1B9IIZ7_9TREE|nr:hypothetical protein L486_06842 [Kwoniella mangroviensis CBS 10435]
MMYTPTPATRRPRPPRSLSRQRLQLANSQSDPTSQKQKPRSHSTPSSVVGNIKVEDTPLSAYMRERREDARDHLNRISASPADVSFALDLNLSTSGTSITAVSNDEISAASGVARGEGKAIGLGISANTSGMGLSEASPPPPYGQSLPSSVQPQQSEVQNNPSSRSITPPRQDSGVSSRRVSTSPVRNSRYHTLRQRSTTERESRTVHEHGRNIGGEQSEEIESEDGMPEGEMRNKLREIKQLLHRREEELYVAARVAEQALQSHEQIMSTLPTQVKARLPPIQDIYTPLSNVLPDSSDSLPYSSHFPTLVQRASSSTAAQPLSPIEDYPSTTSTTYGRLSSLLSPQFPQYTLESPLKIPSPERHLHHSHQLFRTVRNADSSLPFPLHHQKARPTIFGIQSSSSAQLPTPRYTRLAALQAEAEDRIVALEQALSEARDGEENQRKVAARWRKEVDKMQRELLKMDEQRAQVEQDALRESVVGQAGWRRKSGGEPHSTEPVGILATYDGPTSGSKRIGWGYTAFPEFPPAGPSRDHNPQTVDQTSQFEDISLADEPLGQITIDTMHLQGQDADSDVEEQPLSTHLAVHTIPVDEVDSMSTTSSFEGGRTAEKPKFISTSPARQSLRHTTSTGQVKTLKRKSPKSKYLSPKKARSKPASEANTLGRATPRVTIESPHISPSDKPHSRQGSQDSQSSGTSIRRSPWPSRKVDIVDASPEVRRTINFFSHSREGSQSPSISPTFASLSSRMASMRAQINQSLSLGPEIGLRRTLGSELGSEFGDDWDRGLRSLDHIQWAQPTISSPSPPSRTSTTSPLTLQQDHSESEDELEHDAEGDTSCFSPVYQPSYPLPPTVSAALSSLAMALAPSTIFSDDTKESSQILPKGSLREPGIDYSAYELLNEACKMRKITWAEGDTSANNEHQSKTSRLREKVGTTLAPLHQSIKELGMTKDPWDEGEYPDEVTFSEKTLSDDEEKRSILAKSRPYSNKKTLSFAAGTKTETPRKYALAHRRINSSNYQSLHLSEKQHEPDLKGKGKVVEKSQMKPDHTLTRKGLRSIRSSLKKLEIDEEEVEKEPTTIPAKLVHDSFCIISIWLEYVEWFIILMIRICMDIRNGPRGPSGLRKGKRAQRYYI